MHTTGSVRDVIALLVVLGFFALAAGYISWCDRIVRGDEPEPRQDSR
jgi:hypothetical protein